MRRYDDLGPQDVGFIFLVFEPIGLHMFNRMVEVVGTNPTMIREFYFDGTVSPVGIRAIFNNREIVRLDIIPALGPTMRQYIPGRWAIPAQAAATGGGNKKRKSRRKRKPRRKRKNRRTRRRKNK